MDVATRAGLTVGEAAARVGLSVHTPRWYEQEGWSVRWAGTRPGAAGSAPGIWTGSVC